MTAAAATPVATADHRDVPLARLGGVFSRLAVEGQDGWRRYLVRAGLDTDVPDSLAAVIADTLALVGSVLDGALAPGSSWDPAARPWLA